MKIWGWKRAGGRASEPFEANKMSRHAGGRAGGYIWSQAGSSHLKAKWKWFIFCFSWRAARRLPASVCCVAQNKRLESGNCGGRGVRGGGSPDVCGAAWWGTAFKGGDDSTGNGSYTGSAYTGSIVSSGSSSNIHAARPLAAFPSKRPVVY